MSDGTYLLDNTNTATEHRFGALETLYDPGTLRVLNTIGIKHGWHCWEVGAGGGSVAHHLAQHVAPTGTVYATDLNTQWTRPHPAVTVLEHDVTTDPPPARNLDLIHARCVLQHLPGWLTVLDTLVGALAPGGWLVIEELDPIHPYRPDPVTATDHLINRVGDGFTRLLDAHGADCRSGRRLHTHLTAAGLTDVRNTGHQVVSTGGDTAAHLMQANTHQTGAELSAVCGITSAELNSYRDAINQPGTWFLMPTMFTAVGRKPEVTA